MNMVKETLGNNLQLEQNLAKLGTNRTKST